MKTRGPSVITLKEFRDVISVWRDLSVLDNEYVFRERMHIAYAR